MKRINCEKNTFPAIFFRDGDGMGVRFPDLDGCFTCANNYEEALRNAEEALGGWILSQEDMSVEIPSPTPFDNIKTNHGEAIVMISAYPELLREAEKNKAVSRTVTIPNWLNKLGVEARVNFSSLLAGALRQKLGV